MSIETKWLVNQEVLSSKIDDEVILMSLEADSYFGLDPVGSRIWEILSKEGKSINELIPILLEEYEVDTTTCREQVLEFIKVMVDQKLIVAVS